MMTMDQDEFHICKEQQVASQLVKHILNNVVKQLPLFYIDKKLIMGKQFSFLSKSLMCMIYFFFFQTKSISLWTL